MNPIKLQLDIAHEVESHLKDKLERHFGCKVEHSKDYGSFPDWDLKADYGDGLILTYEVKADFMTAITGNVAVEVSRTLKGVTKPTCLSISKADYYVYFLYGAYYFIKTEDLRRLVDEKKYERMIHGVGDGGRANCALFKAKELLKNFKKYE